MTTRPSDGPAAAEPLPAAESLPELGAPPQRTLVGRLARSTARLFLSSEARGDLWFESRRRVLGEPRLPTPAPKSLLVLCHGNLCRSPFAGVLLAQKLPDVRVTSAGLHAAQDHPAYPTAVRVAPEFGVDLAAHRTSKVDPEEIGSTDLVLGFQGHHVTEVVRRWPETRGRVLLLGDFLPEAPHAIEDPWGRPEETFRSVYRRIVQAIAVLTERLEGESA